MITRKASSHQKYLFPPLPHLKKDKKMNVNLVNLQKMVSYYFQIKDNYEINSSFGILHYYLKEKKVENQQIDFGIQFIESEKLEDTLRDEQWQSQNKQNQEINEDDQHFTDDEDKQTEIQPNLYQKSGTFGTHCESSEYYINESINKQKQNNQCCDNLDKTAFFSEMPNMNEKQEHILMQHKRSNTTNMYSNDGRNENMSYLNNISKKWELLEKIKRQKQKKQQQWSRYISIDKQYLKRYLK